VFLAAALSRVMRAAVSIPAVAAASVSHSAAVGGSVVGVVGHVTCVHAPHVSWLLLPSCSSLLYVLWHWHFALQVQVDEWCKENDSQTFCVFIFFIGSRVTGNLIERPPPPGGVSCLLCSLIKNRV